MSVGDSAAIGMAVAIALLLLACATPDGDGAPSFARTGGAAAAPQGYTRLCADEPGAPECNRP